MNPSYLYRAGKPNSLDREAASLLGKDAVSILKDGLLEPVFLTLKKADRRFTTEKYYLRELRGIEDFHRFVDRRFYNPAEFQVTPEGHRYLGDIVADLGIPQYGIS